MKNSLRYRPSLLPRGPDGINDIMCCCPPMAYNLVQGCVKVPIKRFFFFLQQKHRVPICLDSSIPFMLCLALDDWYYPTCEIINVLFVRLSYSETDVPVIKKSHPFGRGGLFQKRVSQKRIRVTVSQALLTSVSIV